MTQDGKKRFSWPQEVAVFQIEKDGVFSAKKSTKAKEKTAAKTRRKAIELFDDAGDTDLWDAQFCPFQPVDQPPILAVITKRHIFIGQIVENGTDYDFDMRTTIVDPGIHVSNYCCTWATDEYDDVVLCVAGVEALIKIYNLEGTLVRTLAGHGEGINALQTSPINPHLIASASADVTVRLWNIGPGFTGESLLAIIGSDAHCDDILTIAFHKTGKWLLSAGQDMVVALWAIPDFPSSPEPRPRQILAPQFVTSEVHNSIIDCVRFWDDLIISRDCHNSGPLLLWRIEGFSTKPSHLPHMPSPTTIAPFSHAKDCFSRSAFAPTSHSNAGPMLWTRLCRLEVPASCGTQFFMRFSVFGEGEGDGVVGFCGAESETVFWNLGYIIEYREFYQRLVEAEREKMECEENGRVFKLQSKGAPLGVERPEWLPTTIQKTRSKTEKEASETSLEDCGFIKERIEFLSKYYPQKLVLKWEERFDVSNRLKAVKPHWKVVTEGEKRVGRQVSWSLDGQWCIVGMTGNLVSFMRRERE